MHHSKSLILLIGFLHLAVVSSGQVKLSVESSKKTAKTGEQGITTNYIDRAVLGITLDGSGALEVRTFFVARDTRTHALKYLGAQVTKVTLRGKQTLKVESEPAAYSRQKPKSSTAGDARGDRPHGWVVLVFKGNAEAAAEASSPEVLKWVRENPPRKQTYISP